MFGILRPCRHTLPAPLADEWMGHLCGLCLALRDGHGQAARVATNYDGLVVSVLAAAQSEECASTRTAGPCPLRGMRRADVAEGEGARLAAVVSLLLASAKISDHVADGDGVYARPGVRTAARRAAARWGAGALAAGEGLGFDGSALAAVADRQREAESAATEGTDVLQVTRPTEEATGEAFAHTALLAGRPGNAGPLREAGRLFGRVAHLLDAVEDLEEDREAGAWNPLAATGTPVERARGLCDDAVLGVSLALREAEFADDRLVHALLVHELRRAVDRTFAHAGYPGQDPRHPHHPGHGYPGHPHQPGHPHGPQQPGQQQYPGHHGPYRQDRRRQDSGTDMSSSGDGSGWGGGGDGGGFGGWGGGDGGSGWGGGGDGGERRKVKDQGDCGCKTPAIWYPPKKRGFFAGCGITLFMCCTCQQCCRDPYPGPWSGRKREAWCDDCGNCDCGGCDCCCCCD
ncbi:DUF5685 family protein [Nocardiopsis potens]|uniref:DUF5685 family protein n=1 Tax=Nocardiopsis potens TaxID=1246458 RepID=UPI000376FD8E|nr:DUF5685 family protein [Nocardiopsis potens]